MSRLHKAVSGFFHVFYKPVHEILFRFDMGDVHQEMQENSIIVSLIYNKDTRSYNYIFMHPETISVFETFNFFNF
jgi:hypothetical protein